MKIVFNYNNSDFSVPLQCYSFKPGFSTISPGNFVQKKYHLERRQPADPQPFPPLHTIFSS